MSFTFASPHPAKALFVRHKVHDCKLLPRKMDEVIRSLFRPIPTNISAAKSMGVRGPKGETIPMLKDVKRLQLHTVTTVTVWMRIIVSKPNVHETFWIKWSWSLRILAS